MESISLSDIGSWASIISLLVTLFVANKVYNISIKIDRSKSNKQENRDSSFLKFGNTEQKNNMNSELND
ncbi:hypothetical protein [Aliarcobacter butzleri]|uniref:hypothetical protein n=1 Tax=Aliarcobacter butzleri TaxID=28197 RepID=UPI0021B2E8C7|nr:hypothetical protein [Aliarcobacter butzleri]MCT7602383.1 hypothetical protein [Aliarcobacter butzleri]